MCILIDECVPRRFISIFSEYKAATNSYDDLLSLVPSINATLITIKPSSIYAIE